MGHTEEMVNVEGQAPRATLFKTNGRGIYPLPFELLNPFSKAALGSQLGLEWAERGGVFYIH